MAAGDSARFEWGALRALAPHLWPANDITIRVRVVAALALLTAAKLATVYVPLLFKYMVDLFSDPQNLPVTLPMALIVGYGALRIAAIAFSELRDAVFARVGQRAIRTVALQTFRHLHSLSLSFHLERQTGGLSRAIERGTTGIDTLLTFMLFNIVPTLIEISLVCGILWAFFSVWYAVVTFICVVGYIWYTLLVTEWRLKYRRQMNETDQEANTRAIDSLLNYETVKYFGNEGYEANRFDQALARYERASVSSKSSLSLLNIGQATIIGTGLAVLMAMAGRGVISGGMTVGDFVLVNTYLIQLYIPLNFLGFVYREIKQALTDMEAMFKLLDVNADVKDAPGRAAAQARPGRGRVRRGHLRIRSAPHDLGGRVVQRAAGETRGHRRRERCRQVHDIATAVSLLRRQRRSRAHRWTGHTRRHASERARFDRNRSAGHRAVQRYDLLQHRLWPRERLAGRDRGSSALRPNP